MVFSLSSRIQGSIRQRMAFGIGLALMAGSSVQGPNAIAAEPMSTRGDAIASPEEIVAELNRVRETPAAYAEWLETLRPYYDQAAFRLPGEMGIRTVEGIYALDHAIATLTQQSPLPSITLEDGLVQSTQGHLTELLSHNRFTLTGLDGSSPMTRAEEYGTLAEGGRLTELLSQGFKSAEAIVASLVIDDGSFNRSTRSLLLNPDITTVGAGCGLSHRDMPLCVFDYATTYHSDLPFIADVDTIATSPAMPRSSTPPDPVLISSADISTALPGSTTGHHHSAQRSTINTATTEDVTMGEVALGKLPESQFALLAETLVTETNLLRNDPRAYAEKLIQLRPYYNGNLVERPNQPALEVVEGIAALDEAIAILQNTPPLPTLNRSEGMSQAAADHAKDLGTANITGHHGSDHSTPFMRMNRYGQWDQQHGNIAGENISYGQMALAEWHIIQLLVDDNFPSRGHRQALLNPDYHDIGTACHAHPTYRIVCDMTYASNYEENR